MPDPMLYAAANATVIQLVVAFQQYRGDRKGKATDAEFEKWLREVAFRDILKAASGTLDAVISLKAHEQERYETLLQHMLAIRKLLEPDSVAEQWADFADADRDLMQQLYALCREDGDHFNPRITFTKGEDPPELIKQVKPSMKFLKERGLAQLAEGSRSISISFSLAGRLFAWEALDRSEFLSTRTETLRHMMDADYHVGVLELAQAVEAPFLLVQALIETWWAAGDLQYRRLDFPTACSVTGASESFKRAAADLLACAK